MPAQTMPNQTSPDASGIVWDSQPAQPTQGTPDTGAITWDNQPTTQTSVMPQSDEIQINPSDNLLTKGGKAVAGTLEGIGEGVFGTVAGSSDLFDRATGTTPGSANAYLHTLAGDNNASHGLPQTAGRGVEDLAEFFLGDEALKGLSVSDRLLKASKTAKAIEESPLLNRVFQAGVRAMRGGAVAGTETGVKTGSASDALTSGVLGGATAGLLPEAVDVAKAAPGAIRSTVGAVSDALRGPEKVVQPALQGSLRQILDDTAAEHGITVPSGTAMRDYAENIGQQLKNRASAIYQTIDNAIGTRFQAFDEQLSNVRRALRDDTGIDHDYTGRLVERQNELEAAKYNAEQEAISKGVDPDTFKNANGYWRQGSALQDLSSKVRQSTSGLPDNLQNGSAAKRASGEVVSPSRLAPKIHALRDSGRLAQAVSSDRADDLIRSVESAKARTADIASKSKVAGQVGTAAAKAAVGTGAAGLAWEAVRHALGF